MPDILIVEDDEDIASLLRRGLGAEGYATAHAATAEGALEMLERRSFDAAIVDMMLGPDCGARLLQDLRLRGHAMPAIVLSARARVEDRAEGLAAGAGDYIVKPFELSEVIARLRVQLLRAEPDRAIRLGTASYDPATRTLRQAETRILLTEREGELLQFMMQHPGQIVSRGAIFDALWAPHGGSAENVVDVYVGYLRRKLAPLADSGLALRTLRGRGFVLTRGGDCA
ncbi:response regulator transcription factor [Halodurantibacterium flavum]|uniref:Response regulator transcription factor n=1 Tax=Halodurantibacterium flavum TaxID=1382802 RepID=A0ABW4S9U7_9RHOB